jgi:quinol monooxygenase YgiN
VTETQISLIARLVAKPGKGAELIDVITSIVPSVVREDGCITYFPHVSAGSADTVVMYEVWASKSALDAHTSGPSFTKLASRFDELLQAPLQVEMLRRL